MCVATESLWIKSVSRCWKLTLKNGYWLMNEKTRVSHQALLSSQEIGTKGSKYHKRGSATKLSIRLGDWIWGRQGKVRTEATLPLSLAYLLLWQALTEDSGGCLLYLGPRITSWVRNAWRRRTVWLLRDVGEARTCGLQLSYGRGGRGMSISFHEEKAFDKNLTSLYDYSLED